MSRAPVPLVLLVLAAAALTACEWNSPGSPDAKTSDSNRPPRADAADDSTASSTGHLLLSEVELGPTGAEFIELTNPTPDPVALDTYYLSDNGNYWKLPAGVPTLSVSDFIVKFPANAMIAPGAVVTVALGSATVFNTMLGTQPTYSITDATMTATAVNGTPALTDTGEIVVLFQWDGQAGLVKDVDMLLAGAPISTNGIVSKSGMTLGSATYATDANTIANQSATPASGKSTKRTVLEDGHETQDGSGNGITGDDETSEDTSMTWDTGANNPTPGQVPTL